MKVSVYRDFIKTDTEVSAERILMGTFVDLYHSMVFLKTMLDIAKDQGYVVRYSIEYEPYKDCKDSKETEIYDDVQ